MQTSRFYFYDTLFSAFDKFSDPPIYSHQPSRHPLSYGTKLLCAPGLSYSSGFRLSIGVPRHWRALSTSCKFLHHPNPPTFPPMEDRSIKSKAKFSFPENRQLTCRMIIRHVKDPYSVRLASVLSAKLNPRTSSHRQSSSAFSRKETGCQNYLRRLVSAYMVPH
ncbi:hypothetical protein TNCV_2154471 [Trichonephila clavipes]|nr:hypothetical protein TNCV_2154471 [Trichonephila clavipes]